jgi:hypothetical protein
MLRLAPLSQFCVRAAFGAALLMPMAAMAVDDYTGAWWRSDESGWGVFLVDQGNMLAPSWFTYGDDGKATWFIVSGAFKQADGSYVGDVYSFTGVPYSQINGQASDPGNRVGTSTFRFTDANTLKLDYNVGGHQQTKTLSRFDWGDQDLVCSPSTAPVSSFTNYTAMWWDPSQSGWGLHVNHVGDLMVATWYTYGADRKAIWLQASTTKGADGVYRGKLYQGTTGDALSPDQWAAGDRGCERSRYREFQLLQWRRGSIQLHHRLGHANQEYRSCRLRQCGIPMPDRDSKQSPACRW